MTISKRQFDLLNVMNIPLWVTKQSNNTSEERADVVEETPIDNSQISIKNSNKINVSLLTESLLFKDILMTLGLSISEVNFENNVVNLGLINWQFSSDNIQSFVNNLLSTPPIEQLEKSPALKRQLWQLLIESELVCR